VPMHAGIATGQKWLQRADILTDATTIPGFYRNGEWRSAQGLARVGDTLANDVRPGGKVSPLEAGEQLHAKAVSEAQFYAKKASAAAQGLEALARKHPEDVVVSQKKVIKKTPVVDEDTGATEIVETEGVEPVVVTMPVYDEWMKTSTPAKRQISEEFSAIDSIINGDDYVPLSVALKNQSALGRMTEATGSANFKTVGEGMASNAYATFHKAVKETVDNIGGTKLYEERQQFTKDK
jgi:hypothetical protein